MSESQISLQVYLVKRSKKGDRTAQSELYRLYAEAMFNICRRMMKNDDDAQDVLQDSFVDAFMRIKSLKNEELFPAWIKRIVVNHCINALKKGAKTQFLEEDQIPDDFEHQGFSLDNHENYKVKAVMEALSQISEGCRVVASLYLFEGYDHKEIAQILSISESASKAQYSKAKAKIRRIISERTST